MSARKVGEQGTRENGEGKASQLKKRASKDEQGSQKLQPTGGEAEKKKKKIFFPA